MRYQKEWKIQSSSSVKNFWGNSSPSWLFKNVQQLYYLITCEWVKTKLIWGKLRGWGWSVSSIKSWWHEQSNRIKKQLQEGLQNRDEAGPEHDKDVGIHLYEIVGHWRYGCLGGVWIGGIKTGSREEQWGGTAIKNKRWSASELLKS